MHFYWSHLPQVTNETDEIAFLIGRIPPSRPMKTDKFFISLVKFPHNDQ